MADTTERIAPLTRVSASSQVWALMSLHAVVASMAASASSALSVRRFKSEISLGGVGSARRLFAAVLAVSVAVCAVIRQLIVLIRSAAVVPILAKAQSPILDSYLRQSCSYSVSTEANWATVAVGVGLGVGDAVVVVGAAVVAPEAQPVRTSAIAAAAATPNIRFMP